MGEQAAQILVAGLAIQSASAPVYACDKTLYLSSNGKICNNAECTQINTYSIPIMTGSNICFNTIDGDKIQIKIKNTNLVSRYQASYYACSFTVKTETTYECKKPGGNCWNNGICTMGAKHPVFTGEEVYPHGYGCKSDTIGCDTWCWHQTSCTWFKWIMAPIIERCYKVYHKTSEIWQTSVQVTYKDMRRIMKLNSNNPTYNLKGYDIAGLKNMPIVLTSFTTETLHLRNSIIVANTNSYEVDASMTNFPVKNTIGEYQMSLTKDSYAAYTSTLQCDMLACKGNCTYDQPSVERIGLNEYNKIPKNQVLKNGEYILKRVIPVTASANLVIGTIELASLQVSASYCKLSIEHTMAYSGCDNKPQVTFKAYDIKQEGLLDFESNCTWTTRFLSCNPEPYIMNLDEDATKCLIHISSTNQTIIVDFNYIFQGSLNLLNTYYAESLSEALENVISDSTFWSSLVGSLNIMAFLSVGSVALIKFARLGLAFKTKKDMESA